MAPQYEARLIESGDLRGSSGHHRSGWRAALWAVAAFGLTVVGVASLVASRAAPAPPVPGLDHAGSVAPPRDASRTEAARNKAAPTQPSPQGNDRSTMRTRASTAVGAAGAIPGAIGPVMARSAPVSVDIPAIGVRSRLLSLDLRPDGTLATPNRPLMAGWYGGSSTPGEPGPAVIVGHVDSWETGPAVFYRLGELAPGEHVVVARSDQSRAVFTVDGVRTYPKTTFPTNLVYGTTRRAELRLITCGDWNASTREYDANVIVFAHLTRAAPAMPHP